MQQDAIQNIWKQLVSMAVVATIIIFYIVPLFFNNPDKEVILAMAAFFVIFNIVLLRFIYKETNKNVKGILIPLLNQNFALNTHSLVSVADLDGTISYVNEKFVEISGYNKAELVGKKHSVLNSNNQPKAYWQDMHKTILAGKTWHDEVRNRAKNGSYYWVDTTIVPNLNTQKQVIGFTSIRTDITEEKHTIAKLAIAKELAEVASVSKSEFLANMSHEIRTPMNGVIGMSNLLLASDLNAEQRKLTETVKSSSVSLLTVINDILDFSKVEAGKLNLELIPFNLGKMIENTGLTMSYQSQMKGLQLICPATPVIQQWVKADPGRIRQILTNLIANAIKFTSHGEIAVYLKLVEEAGDIKTFHFEVRDTGIGIKKSQQERLFDTFSQADNSTTRQYGGTGLGLSICKKLVELMDGKIGVISEEGQGSTFWFTLPLQKTERIDEPVIYNTEISNQRILIVDDNATNLELMHQLHNIWNIPHTLVNSGRAAIKELMSAAKSNNPYSTAILDMHMPEMDGLTLCAKIQDSPLIKSTKLIMASSQAQRGDTLKMKDAGFKGYITKPIQQSELFNVLLMVSGCNKSSPKFVTRHSATEQIQYRAHILVVEDNPTNQLVIEGLLHALGVTVDLASNGLEAISSLQNYAGHDLIFMDCQMPVLDGYEATKKIRSKQTGVTNCDIPIIAMTANAMTGDKEKCLAAGMDDYLAKPIEPTRVMEMLGKWLPKKSLLDNVKIQKLAADVTAPQDHKVAIFDFESLSRRLMNDNELIKSVADMFQQDVEEQLIEIQKHFANNDLKNVTAIAHKVKGTAANVSGIALSALASEIEKAAKSNNIELLKGKIEMLEPSYKSLKSKMEQAIS